uniref:Uncharacterized protein n=1 Tax=Avena sativa TaxID=4498 RepID=A0ACD5T9P0_AVESA
MLPLLRGVVSGRLRRSLSTAASRPPWAMMYRVPQAANSTESVSFSFATPPSVSFMSMPSQAHNIDPHPAEPRCISIHRALLLAASGQGLLLLDTHMTRLKAHPLSDLDLPVEVLYKIAPFEPLYRRFARFVCNPVTGQLFRLPDFEGAEKTLTDGMGLLTQSDGANGPPKRYAAAQLSEVDGWGGRRFLLRRFSSETGDWDDMVLPSPLPPGRRMHRIHEVLDFGGRLWWVDVSWGVVCVDPFSDRPELHPVELPEGSMLPGQQSNDEMRQLVKHRHMGVSAGRLCYAEVGPSHIRSFTLDDESGTWTLEHQLPVADLWPNAKTMPLIATIDPLDTDVLHLNVEEFNVSVDMRRKRMIQSTPLPSGISPPSRSGTTSYLPFVLPSFLESSPIPGKKDVGKNKTLADVLVRSDTNQAK